MFGVVYKISNSKVFLSLSTASANSLVSSFEFFVGGGGESDEGISSVL